jgi:tRNA U34 5-carboxymethylaminomethyl modifying enzyme MnmG/GidA
MASRIQGVTPAALSLLLIYLKKHKMKSKVDLAS